MNRLYKTILLVASYNNYYFLLCILTSSLNSFPSYFKTISQPHLFFFILCWSCLELYLSFPFPVTFIPLLPPLPLLFPLYWLTYSFSFNSNMLAHTDCGDLLLLLIFLLIITSLFLLSHSFLITYLPFLILHPLSPQHPLALIFFASYCSSSSHYPLHVIWASQPRPHNSPSAKVAPATSHGRSHGLAGQCSFK